MWVTLTKVDGDRFDVNLDTVEMMLPKPKKAGDEWAAGANVQLHYMSGSKFQVRETLSEVRTIRT